VILVASKEREFLHFLWVYDPMKDESKLVAYHFTRVVFGMTASPFLLNVIVQHHLELLSESHGHLVNKVLHSIYVADIVMGSQHRS